MGPRRSYSAVKPRNVLIEAKYDLRSWDVPTRHTFDSLYYCIGLRGGYSGASACTIYRCTALLSRSTILCILIAVWQFLELLDTRGKCKCTVVDLYLYLSSGVCDYMCVSCVVT